MQASPTWMSVHDPAAASITPGHGSRVIGDCAMRHWDLYLRIGKIPAYCPLAPGGVEHGTYGGDCARDHGCEDGGVPHAETERRRGYWDDHLRRAPDASERRARKSQTSRNRDRMHRLAIVEDLVEDQTGRYGCHLSNQDVCTMPRMVQVVQRSTARQGLAIRAIGAHPEIIGQAARERILLQGRSVRSRVLGGG